MVVQAPSPPLRLSPDWLPHRYDPQSDAVHFVSATRELRRAVPFLTDEHLPSAADPLVARRRDSIVAAGAPGPIHFILHSAYCCSTLLANAYDEPGIASSLKEPVILNDLVGWRHRGGNPTQIAEVFDGTLRLLSRPFEAGEAVVVKPSNVVNGFGPLMLAMRPQARCILLHAPLRVYLGSIAGKGLWGRLWVRELLMKQLKENLIDLGFAPEDHMMQTDLQVAAVGWLTQHQLFSRLASQHPDRVRSVDSETLLARPAEALEASDALFELDRPLAVREQTIERVFRKHAKFGGAFDRDARTAGQRQAAETHGDEIDKVVIWAETVAAQAKVSFDLPAPLLAD
ncbi:hypothetical protein [Sphingosinicella sp. BN140058]|uniref:hypothetical protein n=1 Tax=Sphingosinicella sp. BN140058 TaxID=1892855 RepID=UPI0010104913|nr:hypothetical protein [Sphingosinicella sp. BN140058]QAY77100.1 hypothetical protein ETR14_11760 [Sphingosinicella sp. BN140058]